MFSLCCPVILMITLGHGMHHVTKYVICLYVWDVHAVEYWGHFA